MSTVPCPSCGMPRAEELVADTACPICGHVGLPTGEPIEELPTPAAPTPPPAPAVTHTPIGAGRVVAAGVLGFVVGTAAGVAGMLGWQAGVASRPQVAADNTPVNAPTPDANSAGSRPPLATASDSIPPPREPVVRATPPADPPAPVPVPAPVADPPKQPPVAVGPQAKPEPDPANPFRPAAPPAMKIDNPGGMTAPVVRPGGSLVLRGRVRTLQVGGLESGATLDASDLEAEEVVVVGKIDGGSKLWVKAPNGRVTFRARIDGRSRVEIDARGGSVAFVPEAAADGAKIDGGAQVQITARSVRLDGTIGGAGTRVAVSITAGGSLAFRELVGPSRLEYGTADPEDPEPSVTRGKVAAPAVVKKVPWD